MSGGDYGDLENYLGPASSCYMEYRPRDRILPDPIYVKFPD